MVDRLTAQDVERLLTDPSPEARVETVEKMAGQFQAETFNEEERGMALEIFSIMVEDAEIRVRQALSDHLKECPDIPHELALSLAKDVDSVAIPVLEFSEILTDQDLIEIVMTTGEDKQNAIARREGISANVADTLVEQGNEKTVATLMHNTTADVRETTLARALDRFGDSEEISTAVTRRPHVPINIAERLVTMVTTSLEALLADKGEVAPDHTADLVLQVRERATLGLVDPRFGIGEVTSLVESLSESNRLTDSIIFRALCMGDIAFFESSLAHLAKISLINAQILIHDEGQLGLQALWGKAGLGKELLPATLVGVKVAEEMGYDGEKYDRERFRRRMLERVLTHFENKEGGAIPIDEESLEYLLSKLETCSSEETLNRSSG